MDSVHIAICIGKLINKGMWTDPILINVILNGHMCLFAVNIRNPIGKVFIMETITYAVVT